MATSSKSPNIKALTGLLVGGILVACCCVRGFTDDDPGDAASNSSPPATGAPSSPSARRLAPSLTPTSSSPAARPKSSPTIRYADCAAVRKAGADPLFAGEPGYRKALDPDGDGVACEDDPDDGGGTTGGGDVYYANCSEARAAGAAPLHRGDPGYSRKLDRDGDGVACE